MKILDRPIYTPKPITRLQAGHEDIAGMVEKLRHCEQREMPLDHNFEPGVYTRTIHMPADTFVIGHVHRFRHINIVSKGRCRVMMDGEVKDIVAPCEFWSDPGVQKVLYIFEDTVWTTVHDNPDDCRDIPTLEERIVVLDDETLARKGQMTLDSLRMSVNKEIDHSLDHAKQIEADSLEALGLLYRRNQP